MSHGELHYRAAGSGPLMIALHESPRSSLSLLPVLEALAPEFRVIAPDTPGYGLSDPPVATAPTLDDFLDIIAQLLDRLGARAATFYGAHTGAALALAFADRAPQRVNALVLDGLSAFTPPEIVEFRTHYLEPYAPDWQGRHVMGLWSRVKDSYTWFPWHERTPSRRLSAEPRDVQSLHLSALGFLQAGRDYAKAYTHAAAFEPGPALARLRGPATLFARPDDLIATHLNRLTPGDGWEIVHLDASLASWRDALRAGARKAEHGAARGEPAPEPDGSRMVRVGEGWVHAVLAGPADGDVHLVFPDLPGDPISLARRVKDSHPGRRVIVISPPGCGWSDPLARPEQELDGVFAVIDEALRSLHAEPASLAGEGAGAALAELWSGQQAQVLPVVRLKPPAWLTDAARPVAPLLDPLSPRWDGAHLMAAWFQLRDLQLYEVPPGAGPPVRRADADDFDLNRFDRLFRTYVEGPECAILLQWIIERVRAVDAPSSARVP